MTEVREKRGLTYGISTWLASGDFGQLYMGYFSSANAKVAEAIGIVRDEWRSMAESGPTQEELDTAKRYLTGAWPLRFDSNGQIAQQLLGLQVAGLDPGYVNRRNELVERRYGRRHIAHGSPDTSSGAPDLRGRGTSRRN